MTIRLVDWMKLHMNRRFLSFLIVIVLGSIMITSYELLSFLDPIRKASAVESFYVGVYWDSDCLNEVSSIDWGELTPGLAREVVIFVRNEEANVPCFLYLWTKDWLPVEGSSYLSLSWNPIRRRIEVGEITSVTLTLRVARDIRGIDDFTFNIVIFGSEHLLGDLNQDGIVDIFDVIQFIYAYNSTPADPNWNSQADLNSDSVVNIFDFTILSQSYMASH